MIEQGSKSEIVHHSETILSQAVVEEIMKTARENLQRGDLMATLFYQSEKGERGFVPLPIPAEHSAKQMYFAMVGVSLQEMGFQVREAILVSETWVVMASECENLVISPSQHPQRKEAITLVGRDALNSRSVFAMQTFHRNECNQPVFDSVEINHFDGSPDADFYSTGLLDFLFSAQYAV